MVVLGRTIGAAFALCASVSINASPTPRTTPAEAGSYDFIIVGGGTAGLALAARLTEDGKTTVLVLEAGGPPDQVAAYKAPGADLQVLGSPIDWAFTTLPQESLNGRQLTYNRGRCLGGSSAINGLTYGRGSSGLYDLWETLGNAGWGWDEVLEFFKKVRTCQNTA
jgi:choline dehydrogenase-like flavoprotein